MIAEAKTRVSAIGRGENLDLADIVCADAKAEIVRLTTELADAKDDVLRLHREKMVYYENIIETETLLTMAIVPDGHDRCKMALDALRRHMKSRGYGQLGK